MTKKIELKSIPANVVIAKPENLQSLLQIFKEQGSDKIHVLADFDRTLTQAFVAGEKITSAIAILRKENILNDVYAKRTEELFNIYHPIEINPDLDLATKKAKMAEWWDLHNQELLKHGLNKKHLDIVAQSPKMQLRQGTVDLLTLLNSKNIPLVIMSSSGLGDYVISKILERAKVNFSNINIISNSLEFDQDGNLTGFKLPHIHVLSKDETMLRDFPAYEKVKERKNVILMGDNIEDIGMVEGFAYDNLIKIGFLNDQVEESLDNYKRKFDLVVTNDGDLQYVNETIKQIV